MTPINPIRVCCFCFSPIESTDLDVRVLITDSADGTILARENGHEDCAHKRIDLIWGFTEVLERNRSDMPSIDPGDTRALPEASETPEDLENIKDRSETAYPEVDQYFGKQPATSRKTTDTDGG